MSVIALVASLSIQVAQAQDLSALFAQNTVSRGPLYPAGAQVELWGMARLTIPETMYGSSSYGAFVLENVDRTVRVRVERLDAREVSLGSDGRAPMTFEMQELHEAYGGIAPEEKKQREPTPVALVDHPSGRLRVLGASDEGHEGAAKKAVKAIGEALRTPVADLDGSQPEALAGKRLTPAGSLEHGFFLDLCPKGDARYAYDGVLPIGGAQPVAESAQEASGRWAATDSAVRIDGWGEDTALWIPRDGDTLTGFTTAPTSCD